MIDTILSIVGTLAGVYIGAIASVKSARITAKEQQHYIESSRFRSIFSSELADLHYGKDDVYKIITDEVIKKHRVAIVNYEAWVPKESISDFRNAFKEYENSYRTKSPGNIKNRQNECADFISKIENILSFADK